MIRWLLSPLALVCAAIAFGLLTLGIASAVVPLGLDLIDHASDWYVLLPLTALSTMLAVGTTRVLLRIERGSVTTLRDHPRQMWLVYPWWLLSLFAAMGGSHVSSLYALLCAACSGVVIGNFFVIVRRAGVSRHSTN